MTHEYRPSILCDGTECFFCKTTVNLARHEVYQGKNRQESKYYGLWITVCPTCHAELHAHPKDWKAEYLNRFAEEAALEHYHWSQDDFISIIGRNYL